MRPDWPLADSDIIRADHLSMPLLSKDPALLKRFRRGEPRALEEVYWAYVDRVERAVRFGFASSSIAKARVPGGHADEIADLVQETFARAFTERARMSYDGLREYGPFLVTIARNLLVDRARKSGREIPLNTFDGMELDVPGPIADEPVADDRTLKATHEYLAALPADLRAVHEQRYVECVSQEEAARRLGLSRQNVRTLEQRLREGLVRHLVELGLSVDESQQPSLPDLRTGKEAS